jgi:ATP-dependent DNA helicase RecG
MLLLGNNIDFEFARIKCARFKGDDVEEFIDQKVFSGILYEQVDNAINFAKTHISKSGVIKDIKREDNYAIPIPAIREAIINAVVHRDYSITGSDIKFAIFDNRVEITSPGVLPKTLSIGDIKSGKSEIRNKVIARIFSEINYIEQWGTGIRRIIAECKKNSLIEPIFEESDLFFKVTIFSLADNNKTPISDDKTPISDDKTPISDDKTGAHKKINEFSEDEIKVITYLKYNEYITNSIARELIGKKDTATKNLLNKLVKKEIIIAIGERKNRIYKMNGK